MPMPVIGLILIPVLAILAWILRWYLRMRKWRPIEAYVVRVEAVDPQIDEDTVGERQYWLELFFQWQGAEIRRSWMHPGPAACCPKAGDTIRLRYHPEKEDFLGVITLGEWAAAVLGILGLIAAVGVLSVLTKGVSVKSVLFLLVPVWILVPIWYWRSEKRLQRKFENGEVRIITARIQGFRENDEGERRAFCLVTVDGQEREITLYNGYTPDTCQVGQAVRLYVDPRDGEIRPVPYKNERLVVMVLVMLGFALFFVVFLLF